MAIIKLILVIVVACWIFNVIASITFWDILCAAVTLLVISYVYRKVAGDHHPGGGNNQNNNKK